MRRKRSAASLAGTDSGNAELFAKANNYKFRFHRPLGGWLVFDGKRWRPDESGSVLNAATQAAAAMLDKAPVLSGPTREETIKHARLAASCRGIEHMLRLAEPLLAITAKDLDRGPFQLNIENGLLNLETVKVSKHRPQDWTTKLAPVVFDPKARCKEFDRLLAHVTGGDADYHDFLQRAVGYTLSGAVSGDAVFGILGPGGSGKSTFLLLFASVLGEYARTIDSGALVAHRRAGGGPQPELDRCKGARLVTAVEMNEDERLDPAILKSVSGGDSITTHGKYRDPSEWRPIFKLWFAVNNLPPLPTKDSGARRRLRVLPFARSIPEEEIDRELRERMAKSPKTRAAFLAWAVHGFAAWRKEGLGSCEAVERATRRYWDGADAAKREADILGRFVVECIASDAEGIETFAALYARLGDLAHREEVPLPSKRRLGIALRAHGFDKADTAAERRWRGLRLRREASGVTDDGMTDPSEKSPRERQDA